MLINILPEQPLKGVADNGSYPALTQAQINTLTDGVTASGGISFGGVSYGVNLCTGGTATASDQYSALYDPPKGADGNQGSWWESTGNPPHWWKYQFTAAKAVTKARLLLGHTLGLKDFTIDGSNDNTNWTTVYTGQAAQSTAWQEFTFTNATAYLYMRLNGTTVWVATNSFRFVEVEMMESLQGSLNALVDITGGGAWPVHEARYFTTETDTTKVTVKSSADGVSYSTHTVTAGGGGYLKAAVGAAARYVTIDHLAATTQSAHEIEIHTQRCPRHAAGRYHVFNASSRAAASTYDVGGKTPAVKSVASRYGVYQPMLKSPVARYHILKPSVRPFGVFYNLLRAAVKACDTRYHLHPPVPRLLNAVDGAELASIITGLLKGGAVTASAPCHLWNDQGGGSALKMGNIRITAALTDGAYTGGSYPHGAECVAGKWVELKSAGVVGMGAIDDAQTVFTPVGGEPAAGGLVAGAIPANAGRVIYLRINVPANTQTPFSASPRLDITYDVLPDPGFGGNFGSNFGG